MRARIFLLFLLIFPSTFILQQNGIAYAQDDVDIAEGEEEEDVQIEDEPSSPPGDSGDAIAPTGEETDDDDDDEEVQLKPSEDADTYFLFTKPAKATTELPAGKDVQFLVGFTNKGEKDFVLDTLDASFRYAMDFSFYIQNFSTISFNRLVKPKQQVTLYYAFYVSESFSSRPFGLTTNLMYHDLEGNQYLDAVFNETINIVEMDEGLDGETFFLYVFMAAVLVLLMIAGQHFLSTYMKRKPSQKFKIEMGTQNANDVDYDWLPTNTLNELNKSPRRSPRQRKVKRGTGAGEDHS